MKQLDYIIVGLGIAGLSIVERLLKNGKTFVAFDNSPNTSTAVAGGVVNPLVLKRLNPVWRAKDFFEEARAYFPLISERLGRDVVEEIPIWRLFNNVEEQNLWMEASVKSKMGPFLSSELIPNTSKAINAPYGFGAVKSSLRVDTPLLLKSYSEHLHGLGCLRRENFSYEKLLIKDHMVRYRDLSAKRIIFAEGTSALKNPFFPKGHLIPKKGEYLTIEAKGLDLKAIVKGPFFIIPLGNDQYKIGATFAHGDTTFDITSEGRNKMLAAVDKLINVQFEVVEQQAGMRPTVSDRRPLIGTLGDKDNIAFFNGLGTRGLLMAPLLSKWLLDWLEEGEPLPNEVDINRFK